MSTTNRTSNLYTSSWMSDAPDITVSRSGKYTGLRKDIELLISGKSPTPFLSISAETPHRAALIAQHVAQYRAQRKADEIQYAKRGKTVFVWNEAQTPMVSA